MTTSPSSSLPSFYVTSAPRMARGADLTPGTVGVAVPAMARLAPARPDGRSPSTATAAPAAPVAHPTDTFEGLMMEALRDL